MAFSEFSRLSLFTVLVLTILIVTLLYNIWKIFHNEKALVTYSQQASRYADAKSSFLAGMSHEIRTPLNSIIGFAEQLEQESLPPGSAEQVRAIRSSSDMLLEVVNQILDFSKYETGKMNIGHSPFRPSEVLKEVIDTMRILADKKGIVLGHELSFDRRLCLEGDAFRLKQVLINLLSNAIKFTNKGEVRLKAWAGVADDHTVVYAEVKDSGIGIDKQHMALIFNEFSQVGAAQSEKQRGTGLGLAICKKIVELQHGAIQVKSAPGKGSVFSFHIPYNRVEDSPCIPGSGSESPDLGQQLRDKHILLAEDNKMSALLAITILKKWKMTCDVAANGVEALALFGKNVYDLVLTDIEMPEMGGVELVKEIRVSNDLDKATTPVLALTAHVMKDDHDQYLDSGINDIAVKPLLERDLVEKIAHCLEKHGSRK
nr:ATP-binding protein [Hufsiella ginkgonis]